MGGFLDQMFPFGAPEVPDLETISPLGPLGPRRGVIPPIASPPAPQPRKKIIEPPKQAQSPQTLAEAAQAQSVPAAAPKPYQEPMSHIRFSQGTGPMQEMENTIQGSESPDAAYRRYVEGTFGLEEAARRAAASMDIEKAQAFGNAYQEGNLNPGSYGAGYARSFADPYGNITAWLDKQGGVHKFGQSPGRAAAIPFEERKAAQNTEFSTDQLGRLEELAKKHDYAIGPYAAKYNNIKRAGLLDFVGATIEPEIAEMYSIAEGLQNAKIYDSSGKAINEAEMKRLKPTMPNVDRSPAEFWVNLEAFKRELQKRGYSLGLQNKAPQVAAPSQGAPVEATPGQPRSYRTAKGNSVEIIG